MTTAENILLRDTASSTSRSTRSCNNMPRGRRMPFPLCTYKSISLVLEPTTNATPSVPQQQDQQQQGGPQDVAGKGGGGGGGETLRPTLTMLASQLEQVLEDRLVPAQQQKQQEVEEDYGTTTNDVQKGGEEKEKCRDDDSLSYLEYVTRADNHWLKVRPPLCPMETILGIPEDYRFSHQHQQEKQQQKQHQDHDDDDYEYDPMVHLTVYHPRRHSNDGSLTIQTLKHPCGCGTHCQPPMSSWERRSLIPLHQPTKEDEETIGISWIELRTPTTTTTTTTTTQQLQNPLQINSQAEALHFLRSVLGTSHDVSPWCSTATTKNTAEKSPDNHQHHHHHEDDIVVVVLDPLSTSRQLVEFRVGDACPSWFLHAVVVVDHLEWDLRRLGEKDSSLSRSPPATLLIYKRLPQRLFLSVSHPQQALAPPTSPPQNNSSLNNKDNTTSATVGCLWETVVVKIDDPHHNNKKNTKDQPTPPPQVEHFYRLTCPPYVNLKQDYPKCQALFEPQHIQAFTREALRIGHWIPWPETQHYTSHQQQPQDEEGDGENMKNPLPPPWTVVPLCHCFPANQVEQFQWIDLCKRQCPETCDILQQVLGTTLRTALFSQLAPHTTLEPHTGWSDLANHVLRLHIPLIVPGDSSTTSTNDNDDNNSSSNNNKNDGLCGTWVDGCVETHTVGQPIVFDDSKLHRAFNYSDQTRIVLIVDLERPAWLPTGTATGGHSEQLDAFIQQMASG